MIERQAILLVRLDGVGDAALCIPALHGLSVRYPHARFGAVCSPANATLFSQRMQRVFVYDSTTAGDAIATQLAREAYTHALVATEEVMGYKLARASGARFRAGFWHGLQKPFKSLWQRTQLTNPVYRPAAWTRKPQHEVTTMYLLAQALGAQAPAPADPQDLRTWLNVAWPGAMTNAQRRIAFQITPKLLTQGWGPAALAEMIDATLRVVGGERCVLLAAAPDEGLAAAILEQVPAAARTEERVTLVSSLSLPDWLSALAGSGVIVTPDTGAAHVAGMLGVPVVDLFEADGFERLSQQWRPWAAASRCLAKPQWHARAAQPFGSEIGSAIRELRA